MDSVKESGSTSRPPLLDWTNYGYWKAWMCALIKSIDEKEWRSFLLEWKPPTKSDVEDKTVPKSEAKWTPKEGTLSTHNSLALNAIFNGVDPTQFKMISTTKVAKETWNILRVSFEGADAIRESRLELLTIRFQNLQINEEETIIDFNGRLCDIVNESFTLGEKIP